MDHQDHTAISHDAQPKLKQTEVMHAGHTMSAMQGAMGDMDHSAHEDHSEHDEHAGHDSPNDMLRRFIISFIVTIPIVLFSPIGSLWADVALGIQLARAVVSSKTATN